jgi:hypothetical protein
MATETGDSGNQTPIVERRRHPRQKVPAVTLSLPATYIAEVLDISGGGALISTPGHVARGQRGQLRTLLDREPFSAIVEVMRVEPGTRGGLDTRDHVGLTFVSLDDNSRRTLNKFVKGKTR